MFVVQLRSSIRGTPIRLLRFPTVLRPGPVSEKYRGEHLLDGGLAVASGNSSHGDGKTPAVKSRQVAEGAEGVLHRHDRCAGGSRIGGKPGGFGKKHPYSPGCRRRDKIMAVETLPLQRDEQFTCLDLTGVGGDP